jgi:hypothetical protein
MVSSIESDATVINAVPAKEGIPSGLVDAASDKTVIKAENATKIHIKTLRIVFKTFLFFM